MKIQYVALVIFAVLLSTHGQAQEAQGSKLALPGAVAPATAATPQEETPAQQRIAGAKRVLATNPTKLSAVNDLAIAYVRRARETDNSTYLTEADKALAQGFELAPTDFQLQKTQVASLLAQHRFTEAREKATSLNHSTPDDVMTYGYLAEAEIALGNYAEAEKSAQWMLNMRSNNIPGLLIGATLRTVYGDSNGALELMKLAYAETSPTEVEDLAWIANRMAAIQIDLGETEAASALLGQAEELFPNYPYTLENLSRIKLAQHRSLEAVNLLHTARKLDANPRIAYELALAEAAAGETANSLATYKDFEELAIHVANPFDESQRDLIFMYAADPATVSKSLNLAERQIALRHDIWTEDAYAWALYVNGKYFEAESQEQKAIAEGIQNAQIFDHAAHIAQKLNHSEDAAKYFELVLKTNSSSIYSADARQSMGLTANTIDQKQAGGPAALQADNIATIKGPSSPALISTNNELPIDRSIATFAPVPAKLLIPAPTDTDRVIHTAQASAARNPKDATGYSTLGAAYFQRARETGDVSDYQLAEESLTKSLDLVSADFSADEPLGTMAEVCMGEHRFSDALAYSQKALSLGSGDVSPFAIVGDAYADMGDYSKAAQAYSRLTPRDMTLSPRAAYARDSRLAYLKFIGGDTLGAINLMKGSVAEGIEAQLPKENLAWLYYELGEFQVQAGDAAAADKSYVAALTVHPGDYRALAGLGKLRANNGRYAEAIVLYQKAIDIVPMPMFVEELGDLYAKLGDQPKAAKQYQLVEYIGLLGHINQVLHNRDLALFYADHDIKLSEALELARKELEVRHDVYTWDALAWALYKNGKMTEASEASKKALQFSTKDSLLLYHAAMIAERAGARQQAKDELAQALQINPHFHVIFAPEAQRQLALINSQTSMEGSHAR